MNEKDAAHFSTLTPSEKILFVLKSDADFGGPQSAELLCKLLDMKRKNLDSLLSRLCLKRKIERITLGTYRCPGDHRTPKY